MAELKGRLPFTSTIEMHRGNLGSHQISIISPSNYDVFQALSFSSFESMLFSQPHTPKHIYLAIPINLKIRPKPCEDGTFNNVAVELHPVTIMKVGKRIVVLHPGTDKVDTDASLYFEEMIQLRNSVIVSDIELFPDTKHIYDELTDGESDPLPYRNIQPILPATINEEGIRQKRQELNGKPVINRSAQLLTIGDILWQRFQNEQDDISPFGFQPLVLQHLGAAMLNKVSSNTADSSPSRFSIVAPTGSGKTKMQAELIKEVCSRNLRNIVYVTSRRNLVHQSFDEIIKHLQLPDLQQNLVKFYGDSSNRNFDNQTPVIITTYHSFTKLMNQMAAQHLSPPLVIFDEAHNLFENRQNIIQHQALTNSVITGWTATEGSQGDFERLGFIETFTMRPAEGILRGALCPVQIIRYKTEVEKATRRTLQRSLRSNFTIDEKAIEALMKDKKYIDTVVHLALEYSRRQHTLTPTIIEAHTIDQAKRIYSQLSKALPKKLQNQVAIIQSNIPNRINRQILDRALLKADDPNKINIIISVEMLTEGVNLPEFGILIKKPRPTSEVRTYQSAGRVLRTDPNNPKKIAKIIEVFPVRDPEYKGFYTALHFLGLGTYDPNSIFRGDFDEYYRSVTLQRLAKPNTLKKNIVSLPRTDNTYELIGATTFRRSALQIHEIVTGMENKEIYQILLNRAFDYFQANGKFTNLLKITDDNASEGVKWIINRRAFAEVFGIEIAFLVNRGITQDIIIDIIQQIENTIGFESMQKICQSPENLFNHLFKQLDQILPTATLSSNDIFLHFFQLIGFGRYSVRALFKEWHRKGLLPQSIKSAKQFFEIVLFWKTIDEYRQEFPFILPKPDMYVQSPSDLFKLLETSIVDYFKNKIEEFYKREKFYIEHSGYFNQSYRTEFAGINTQKLNRFFSQLKTRTLSLRFKEDFIDVSIQGNNVLSYFYQKALQMFIKKYGRRVIENPYSNLKSTVEFMAKRMKAKGITNLYQMPLASDPERFTEIFLISPSTLRGFCSQKGVTVGELLSNALRINSETHRISYRLYNYPNSVYDLVHTLAVYYIRQTTYPRNPTITTTNFFKYFPDIPREFSKTYRNIPEETRSSRQTLKTLSKRFNIPAAELTKLLTEEIGILFMQT